jgi:hypothetical protein
MKSRQGGHSIKTDARKPVTQGFSPRDLLRKGSLYETLIPRIAGLKAKDFLPKKA